jgi:hypothetical protein
MRWRVDAEGRERWTALPRGGIEPGTGAPALRRLEGRSTLDHGGMSGDREQGSILSYLVLLLVVVGVVRATRTPVVMEISKGTIEGPAPPRGADVASAEGAGRP